MPSRPSLRTIAITLTAALLPLSMLMSNIVTALYKASNPENVDITAGLAYLRQSLFAGFGTALIIGAIVVWLIVSMYRRDRNFIEAKLPLVLLCLVVFVLIISAAVSSYTGAVEDQYRRDHALRAR